MGLLEGLQDAVWVPGAEEGEGQEATCRRTGVDTKAGAPRAGLAWKAVSCDGLARMKQGENQRERRT